MANHELHIKYFFSLKYAYFNSRCKAAVEVPSGSDMRPENCSPMFPHSSKCLSTFAPIIVFVLDSFLSYCILAMLKIAFLIS